MSRNLATFAQYCRKAVCVGRNYAEHAKELGNAVPSGGEKPLLFMKPSSSIITQGQSIEIPIGLTELHHEIELGIVIGSKCSRASPEKAVEAIGGYVLALDMTARSVQNELKSKGHPWEMAKCFDTSLALGEFIPKDKIPDPHEIELQCRVNEELRQKGSTSDMIFRIPHLLSFISTYFTLEEGDLVLTGTPSGVGPVKNGDVISGQITGVADISFSVVQRSS